MAAVGLQIRESSQEAPSLSSTSARSSWVIYLLFLSLESFTAPTLPPTTAIPSTTPTDECDDDQASCHSGTGDDYDVTGANIALMRLRASPAPLASPPLIVFDIPFVAVESDTVATLLSCAHMHARTRMHVVMHSSCSMQSFQPLPLSQKRWVTLITIWDHLPASLSGARSFKLEYLACNPPATTFLFFTH